MSSDKFVREFNVMMGSFCVLISFVWVASLLHPQENHGYLFLFLTAWFTALNWGAYKIRNRMLLILADARAFSSARRNTDYDTIPEVYRRGL